MPIPIKNDNQLARMREAGIVVGEIFALLEADICPGMSTRDIERLAVGHMRKHGAVPSFKGYRDFPGSICTSVNNEVIHGIPSIKKLKSGDIISIDVGVYLHGFHTDAARTFPVGEVSSEALRLIDVTRESFYHCIQYAKHGRHLHEISQAVEEYAEMFGFSVVKDYVGHGIGKDLHEAPQIPMFRQKTRGPRLSKGMTLAIEPMLNQGTHEVDTIADNWTVVTKDGKLSAHYENTVLITDDEPEILTKTAR